MKYSGVDQIIDTLIKKLGDVKTGYLVGDYARGLDSGLIDIILIGDINHMELNRIAEKKGQRYLERFGLLLLQKKIMLSMGSA